jgi:hypothetical protein
MGGRTFDPWVLKYAPRVHYGGTISVRRERREQHHGVPTAGLQQPSVSLSIANGEVHCATLSPDEAGQGLHPHHAGKVGTDGVHLVRPDVEGKLLREAPDDPDEVTAVR